MANLKGGDKDGNDWYVRGTGAGSNADPFTAQNDLFTSSQLTQPFSLSASGDIITAVTGSKIRVVSLLITASAAITVKFQRAGTTDLTGALYLPANGSISISNPLGLFETGTGERLNAVLTGTGTYTGFVTYRLIS